MIYAGFGHANSGVVQDWYKLDSISENIEQKWTKILDFESKKENFSTTDEARVAGTQGKLADCGLGFVLSGDGDNHGYMKTGEFHVYNPKIDVWEELPPHPGVSRWAPGSFVIGKKVYFTSGMDRKNGIVLNDLWEIDLTSIC